MIDRTKAFCPAWGYRFAAIAFTLAIASVSSSAALAQDTPSASAVACTDAQGHSGVLAYFNGSNGCWTGQSSPGSTSASPTPATQGAAALGAALGTALGNAVGKGLHDAMVGNPQEEAARRASAEAAEAQRQQAIRQQNELRQRQAEETASRLLGGMIGSTAGSGELSYMPSEPTAAGTGTNFFGANKKAPGPDSAAQGGSVGGMQLMTASDFAAQQASASGISAGIADKAPTSNPIIAPPVLPNTSADPAIVPATAVGGLDRSATVQLIPRSGDPEHPALGDRYVDCRATRAQLAQLQSGMSAQKDWLDRLKAQIDGDKFEQHELSKKQLKFGIDQIIDGGKDLAVEAEGVKTLIEKLQAGGYPTLAPQKREQLLKALEIANKGYDGLTKSWKALKAGWDEGQELGEAAGENSQEKRVAEVNGRNLLAIQSQERLFMDTVLPHLKNLDESGIPAELGENLAELGFGPAGKAIFKIADLGIEAAELAGESLLSKDELSQAQWQYDHLRDLYDALQERIDNDRADLHQYCGGA